jgi:hypothetical protein
MSRRVDAGGGGVPAARTTAGWVALVAGMVLTATGLFPARASAGSGEASVATGSPASTSTTTTTTTTTSSSSTTTTTGATSSSSSTTTTTGSSSTTTELVNSTTTTAGSLEPRTNLDPVSSTTTSITSPASAPPGILSISAPDLTNLGATGTGDRVVSARLGTVTVTDSRGVVDGAWTARVSATPFATGGGSAGEQVKRSSICYWSGPVTARTGTAVLVPGQRQPSDAVRLTSTRVAFSATGVTGHNTASWRPTVSIRVPDAAVAGSYRGVIIHSVA